MKLDFGCGPNPREGFEGVDIYQFDGKVKHVFDIRQNWPWPDNSVDEFFSSHFIEHLEWPERIHFFNELWRVCKPDATGEIISPHPMSIRYYGDPTHKAPMSEFAYYYLSREWRKANAPHVDGADKNGYVCDIQAVVNYSLHPITAGRNEAWVQMFLTIGCEVRQDMLAKCVIKK